MHALFVVSLITCLTENVISAWLIEINTCAFFNTSFNALLYYFIFYVHYLPLSIKRCTSSYACVRRRNYLNYYHFMIYIALFCPVIPCLVALARNTLITNCTTPFYPMPHSTVRARGVKSRMCPPYPQRVVKGDYCKRGNFRVGVIFAFFALLYSSRKLPPREIKTHMPLWRKYE